ncbi:hypothetical protein JCM19233_1231 [Vibrio astriarenae]|nr:hypothetical protein JCM19233_1231 [Vibrio sp. C7]
MSLSFMLVVVMGLMLCWKALKQIYQTLRKPKLKIKAVKAMSPQMAAPTKGGWFTTPLRHR